MGGCLRCGRCCTNFGVCIMPADIRRLSHATGLDPASFAMCIPEPPGRERAEPAVLIDGERSLIVLRWRGPPERKCMFHSASGCQAYADRPMLCRTYPFRLDGGAICSMKSRACPVEWFPAGAKKEAYLRDMAEYEKELAAYAEIASWWNRNGGGTLAQFLGMVMGAAPPETL